MSETIVLKLGSSVLRSHEDLPAAVHEVYRWYRREVRVVAVVSAVGEATEQLIALATSLSSDADPHAAAELLATGERAAAALLAIALDRSGVSARIVDPREIALTVSGSARDSEAISVDDEKLEGLIGAHPVLIIPGFFGAAADGRTHLLGRGGSDLSAVFLASHISGSRCRMVKDVDAVYDTDPALTHGKQPRRYVRLHYDEALQVAGRLIQPKAVAYLKARRAHAAVAAAVVPYETQIDDCASSLSDPVRPAPLNVLLLGLGTVGLGVHSRILAHPEHFAFEAALVRNQAKYEALGVPANQLQTDVAAVMELTPDLVVDALPGLEPSREIVEHFISRGIRVVSANKTAIEERIRCNSDSDGQSLLRYSASVGGSTPMLETVERIAARTRVKSIAAVLNGTCNFVLDCCARGAELEEALAEARRLGFAELDASDDLKGHDARRKLNILSRHAFGALPASIDVQVLNLNVANQAAEGRPHTALRQIARISTHGDHLHASIGFESMPRDSFFGKLDREWNGIEIRTEDGNCFSSCGRGAGRWPTTEAVMADLFDFRRARYGNVAKDG